MLLSKAGKVSMLWRVLRGNRKSKDSVPAELYGFIQQRERTSRPEPGNPPLSEDKGQAMHAPYRLQQQTMVDALLPELILKTLALRKKQRLPRHPTHQLAPVPVLQLHLHERVSVKLLGTLERKYETSCVENAERLQTKTPHVPRVVLHSQQSTHSMPNMCSCLRLRLQCFGGLHRPGKH